MSTRVLHVLDHSLSHLSGYAARTHYLLQSQRQLGLTPIAVTSPKHGADTGQAGTDGITYLRTPAAFGSFRPACAGQWQPPTVFVLLVCGGSMVTAQSSALGPFIYALF